MFSFFLGSRASIARNPRSYLVAIKRMLPRWANSLPDSEYQALIDLIGGTRFRRPPVFVETGVGASTLLLIHYAMERGGHVFSWDMNGSKGSFIRSVAAETLEAYHRKAIARHWTFVSSSSLSPYTGLAVLSQLTRRVDLSLHDSDHTWQTITGEIRAVAPLMQRGALICVDDANQDSIHTYEPIINMTRQKLGLPPIPALRGNRGRPHFERIPGMLRRHFSTVMPVDTTFASHLRSDPYYVWYERDRQSMATTGMERLSTVSQRFGVWRVAGRPGAGTGRGRRSAAAH